MDIVIASRVLRAFCIIVTCLFFVGFANPCMGNDIGPGDDGDSDGLPGDGDDDAPGDGDDDLPGDGDDDDGKLRITTDALPNAMEWFEYDLQMEAANTNGLEQWGVSFKTPLPAGLVLDIDGRLHGTPEDGASELSPYTVEIQVFESLTLATKEFEFIVEDLPTLTVETDELDDARELNNYNYTLTASGGYYPDAYDWSLTAPNLPSWMSIDSEGLLSGIPPVGEYLNSPLSLDIVVQDSKGNQTTKPLDLVVLEYIPELAVTTGSLPDAVPGDFYSVTLSSSRPDENILWNETTGLPPGLYISGDQIAGTPTNAAADNSYPVTLIAVDEGELPARDEVTIFLTVLPHDSERPVSILTSALFTATEGEAYSMLINANGGVGAYDWSSSHGFPTGLVLVQSGSSVILSGTPAIGTAGTHQVVVSVYDEAEGYDTATYLLIVNPALAGDDDSDDSSVDQAALGVQLASTGGGCNLGGRGGFAFLPLALVLLAFVAGGRRVLRNSSSAA